ncbi:MAG: Vitamin B12 dependent methionine synthase activation subunit [Hungatella sp.]|nr:Vitamin B12 dependent methionine synthase activation subunit [Hungatella sp.]
MDMRETLRYLGYRGHGADDQTLELAEECWEELEQKAERRVCFKEFPLTVRESIIDMGCFQTKSQALEKNLKHCRQVVLFAATLGVQADSLIRRYSRLQMSRAVVMQAVAAAMLEEYCDQVNEEIRREYEKKGLYLRPRFSPGYGDFPIQCQSGLLGGLEAGKRIGITLTDSLLMIPSKSVSAVIGVSPVRRECIVKGCEACGSTDCIYRRETV